MEYLCFLVTHDGVTNINRKIEAIANMNPPTSQKEVRKFISVINYCCNMWPRRLHTLASLIFFMSIRQKFEWKQVEYESFGEIKRIMARDTL